MKVLIEYTIPVVVTVDIDEGEVTRVDEYREELGSCWPVVTGEDGSSVDGSVENEAIRIAGSTTWPVWELA